MMKSRYVAEGFLEDAGRLLHEFTETNSVDFTVFASLWKKHNFSLVFMGRADKVELSEFTNEAYRVTTQFLASASYLQRVGAIFLLYGLFRNQVSNPPNPPIKIRIELSQWKIIDKIWKEAAAKNYHTLNYVIDYLINNAFVYVANQTLKGPMVGTIQTLTKNAKMVSNLKATYKEDLFEYKEKNKLANLYKLQDQYSQIKKELEGHVNLNFDVDTELYAKYIGDLDSMLYQNKRRNEGSESIGARRAKIKAAAFINKSSDFWDRRIDSDESDSAEDIPVPVKKTARVKRTPKHLRRVGRPKKYPKAEQQDLSEESDVDISNLLNQHKNFFLPPDEEDPGPRKRRPRAVRQPYYKTSPKHEESDN